MSVYYDELVLAGAAYRPPVFGQNATPGWADDLVIVQPLAGTPSPDSGGGTNTQGRLRLTRGRR